MPAISKDPIGWTAQSVSTPLRLWLTAATVACMHAVLLMQLHTGERTAAVTSVLLLCSFQCLFLVALRRVYLALRESQAGRPVA